MVNIAYVPSRGDVVWLDFAPQREHEQKERRPAIVLSPRAYNDKVGLAIFCPITNQQKGYPFEVEIPEKLGVTGIILSDQIKSLDWRARRAEYLASVPNLIMNDLMKKLEVLLF